MEWNLVTDSSCNVVNLEKTKGNIFFSKVPFILRIDNIDYVDDSALNVDNLLLAIKNTKDKSSSSCPSPDAWYNEFIKCDNTIAITISGGLSGSYESAMVAKNMVLDKNPKSKIFVLDSCSAGAGLDLIFKKLCSLIDAGLSFDEVVEQLQEYQKSVHTIFALCSFDNFINNGRISRVMGFIAKILNVWGIGIGVKGKIDIVKKVRGKRRALDAIVDDIKTNKFLQGNVAISHCENEELAEQLKAMILAQWPKAEVSILSTSGLCSYYAERGGIIVAY